MGTIEGYHYRTRLCWGPSKSAPDHCRRDPTKISIWITCLSCYNWHYFLLKASPREKQRKTKFHSAIFFNLKKTLIAFQDLSWGKLFIALDARPFYTYGSSNAWQYVCTCISSKHAVRGLSNHVRTKTRICSWPMLILLYLAAMLHKRPQDNWGVNTRYR